MGNTIKFHKECVSETIPLSSRNQVLAQQNDNHVKPQRPSKIPTLRIPSDWLNNPSDEISGLLSVEESPIRQKQKSISDQSACESFYIAPALGSESHAVPYSRRSMICRNKPEISFDLECDADSKHCQPQSSNYLSSDWGPTFNLRACPYRSKSFNERSSNKPTCSAYLTPQSHRISVAGSIRSSSTRHRPSIESGRKKSVRDVLYDCIPESRGAQYSMLGVEKNANLPCVKLNLSRRDIRSIRSAWSYSRRSHCSAATDEHPGLAVISAVFKASPEVQVMFTELYGRKPVGRRQSEFGRCEDELSRDLRSECALQTLQALESTHISEIEATMSEPTPSDIGNIFDRFRIAMIAQQLTHFLDSVVSHLDDMENLQRNLFRLGQRHVDFVSTVDEVGSPRSTYIRTEHWISFAEAFSENSLEWGGNFHQHSINSRTLELWVELCSSVVECVRQGYMTELRARRRKRSNYLATTPDAHHHNQIGTPQTESLRQTNELELLEQINNSSDHEAVTPGINGAISAINSNNLQKTNIGACSNPFAQKDSVSASRPNTNELHHCSSQDVPNINSRDSERCANKSSCRSPIIQIHHCIDTPVSENKLNNNDPGLKSVSAKHKLSSCNEKFKFMNISSNSIERRHSIENPEPQSNNEKNLELVVVIKRSLTPPLT